MIDLSLLLKDTGIIFSYHCPCKLRLYFSFSRHTTLVIVECNSIKGVGQGTPKDSELGVEVSPVFVCDGDTLM
jgi:hypothetical protein